MKKFEIDVDINGTITFEVEAKNKIQKYLKTTLNQEQRKSLQVWKMRL